MASPTVSMLWSWCDVQWAESEIVACRSSPALVQRTVEAVIGQGGGRVDYIVVEDADSLQALSDFTTGREVLVAVAAFFGTVRLIDNVVAVCGA